MNKKKIGLYFIAILFTLSASAAEFIDFSPSAQNIIPQEMIGKKFQCYLNKSKNELLSRYGFEIGNSVFIEVKKEEQGINVFLQSPERPEPHSLEIQRLTISNGASFDISIKGDGFLFFKGNGNTIKVERMIEAKNGSDNGLETLFVGFCAQINEIPSEGDIARMGYIFRIHDYCNETRQCL